MIYQGNQYLNHKGYRMYQLNQSNSGETDQPETAKQRWNHQTTLGYGPQWDGTRLDGTCAEVSPIRIGWF